MAAQKGLGLLLKIDTASSGSANYVTVGGLRSTSITLNEESVDVTNKDSAGQRTLLAGGGVQSVSISGSGVFTDSTTEVLMRTTFAAQSGGSAVFKSFQIIVPDLGTFSGSFQITSLEYAGEYNGEATYSVSLESAGAITFA
jgi:TP901-1 family phage major tail protein